MGKLRGWLVKHCTEENSDSIKCKHCGKVVSKRDRMQELKDHLCDIHNITELDEHPKRGDILENYEVSKYTATCNHCKKIKNFKPGVYLLINHLKLNHSDKCNFIDKINSQRRSNIWDKYDVKGNDATCKTCKKVIKHYNNTGNLWNHLRTCENDKRISSIWNKYQVTNNCAKCKECSVVLKLPITYKTRKLKRHLQFCEPASTSSRPMRDNDSNENEPQRQSGIQTRMQLLKQQGEQTEKYDESYSSSESDENLREALIKSRTEAKISDLKRKRTGIIDESAPSSSRSMRDTDFHGNEPQRQRRKAIQTSMQLLNRQEEEIEKSDDPIQAQNLIKDLIMMKSWADARIPDSRKRGTDVINESYSNSESVEDLCETSINEIEDGRGNIYRFEKRK